jgi:ADP-ribosyl-[dinitrogen reductase] hydrolase
MLGAIIGDVAGSFREFTGAEKFPELGLLPDQKDLPEAKEINNKVPRYGLTDDSLLTLATAYGCMRIKHNPVDGYRNEDHFKRYYQEYANKYKDPIGGFGAGFRAWAEDRNAPAYHSCGNGSAMRVSPVAYVAKTQDELLTLAFESAIPTHNHPEGIKGAQATAMMIFLARNGWKLPQIIYSLEKQFLSYEPIEGYDHFDCICQETMRLTMHCLRTTDNFHDAVFKAVTIPHADSDTLGAIVGSIAEALYGIPEELIKKGESFITDEHLMSVYVAFKETYMENN